jgi:hypothetical protein
MTKSKPFVVLYLLLRSTSIFSQDSLKNDSALNSNETIVNREEIATYPGGETAWRKYLEKNIDPFVPVKNGSPVGKFTVLVSYSIDKDGTISDLKPLTDFGYGMEDEFIRVLKKAKGWTPSKLNGKPLKTFLKQSTSFFVVPDKFDIKSKVMYELFARVDNEITVWAKKTKFKDLQLTISEGTIIPGTGEKFIVRVDQPGRVQIQIFNTKKNEKVGVVSFEVKETY